MEIKGLGVNARKNKVMWCVRFKIMENIHVVFAGKELVSVQ